MRKETSVYRKGILIALASTLLLTTVLAIRLTWQTESPRQIFVGPVPPYDFTRIQEAINNATEGDIIEVTDEGSPYIENVIVNKSVTIRRWTALTPQCIVDGNRTGPVFKVTASNVRIFNFTIQNGTYGIYLSSMSENNIIADNKITLNRGCGVFIDGARNNTLSGNLLSANYRNFGIAIDEGLTPSVLEDFIQYIDDSNTINGNPIYYWVNKHDEPVPTNASYIVLVNCTNITVKGAALKNNTQGILLAYTKHSIIENMDIGYNDYGIQLWYSNDNNITTSVILDNDYGIAMDDSTVNRIADNVISYGSTGIYLSYCSYNTFAGNNVTNCRFFGISAQWSSDNVFYHNNMMNDKGHQHFRDDTSFNTWNNGREGNYWSDYQGNDTDGDGIGDTSLPHQLEDYYPLVKAWSSVRSLNIRPFLEILNIACPKEYTIATYSDHVVASIKYYMNDSYITFNLTAGSSGYCSVTIPRDRLDCPFRLFFNGTLVEWADHDISVVCNATHSSIYFNYTADRYMVKIDGDRKGDMIGDLNGDGLVDMRDIGIVCSNFRKSMPYVIPPQE